MGASSFLGVPRNTTCILTVFGRAVFANKYTKRLISELFGLQLLHEEIIELRTLYMHVKYP